MADGHPRMFHELCSHIYKAVSVSLSFKANEESHVSSTSRQKIWPNARFAALGAFVFLRSVYIVMP